jgi:hypothetical protein
MTHLYYTPIPLRQSSQYHHAVGRILLCDVLGCGAAEVQLAPNGKPFLPGGLWFSISHCDGLVLLAVSGVGEVGCDCEPLDRPIRNPEAIRKKLSLGQGDILALWVAFEAKFKAGGAGELYYPVMPGGYIAQRQSPASQAALYYPVMPGGYIAAVCSAEPCAAPEKRALRLP